MSQNIISTTPPSYCIPNIKLFVDSLRTTDDYYTFIQTTIEEYEQDNLNSGLWSDDMVKIRNIMKNYKLFNRDKMRKIFFTLIEYKFFINKWKKIHPDYCIIPTLENINVILKEDIEDLIEIYESNKKYESYKTYLYIDELIYKYTLSKFLETQHIKFHYKFYIEILEFLTEYMKGQEEYNNTYSNFAHKVIDTFSIDCLTKIQINSKRSISFHGLLKDIDIKNIKQVGWKYRKQIYHKFHTSNSVILCYDVVEDYYKFIIIEMINEEVYGLINVSYI